MQWDLLLGACYGKGRARREGLNAALVWRGGHGLGPVLLGEMSQPLDLCWVLEMLLEVCSPV